MGNTGSQPDPNLDDSREMQVNQHAWSTMYRAPQMRAVSGAWLEAFSKGDAQAMLMAAPWTVLMASLIFFIVIYALEAVLPSISSKVISAWHYLLALICALYIPVALLIERPSQCCRDPRRSREGWIAVGAVGACAIIAFCYARSMQSLPDRTARLPIIYGSFAFRAASTGEFYLQIAWLWAAAGLQCEPGQEVSPWRRWSYFLLAVLWSFTWWGTEGDEHHKDSSHPVVFIGCLARLVLFLYCITRVCRKCSGPVKRCCWSPCCGEWRTLENHPLEPGSARLRCLLFYLLVRPPFLLVMNLPLGYPVAFFATWAFTLRCCLILVIAVSLRPAPVSVFEHNSVVEKDTREKFDLILALHLWDFSYEAYCGKPAPAEAKISKCGHANLNGLYMQDGRAPNGSPIYKLQSVDGKEAILQHTDGVWEVFVEKRRLVYSVYAEAESADAPHKAKGAWTEVHLKDGEETQEFNEKMEIEIPTSYEPHDSFNGSREDEVPWLLAEQQGVLTSQGDGAGAEQGTSASSSSQKEVSIVLAFRGTASVQNLSTDVKVALEPLVDESKVTQLWGSLEGRKPACFDLAPKVGALCNRPPEERSEERSEEQSSEGINPFPPSSPSMSSGANVPLRVRSGSREIGGEPGEESTALPGCCRLLTQCCKRLVFPCVPSDFEDDDVELNTDTWEQVLKDVMVHRGFQQAYCDIRKDVLAKLQERLEYWRDEGFTAKVYATGHSLGGAIANLFALDLSAASSDSRFPFDGPVVCYTFGAPRGGNAAFRSVYNAVVPQTFRIVGFRDLVPALPPSFTYRQMGKEVWVDDAGELTYVMSWAMRHILPSRDDASYHLMTSYFRLLHQALQRTSESPLQSMYESRFRGESELKAILASISIQETQSTLEAAENSLGP